MMMPARWRSLRGAYHGAAGDKRSRAEEFDEGSGKLLQSSIRRRLCA
jgi:hypothetical protein